MADVQELVGRVAADGATVRGDIGRLRAAITGLVTMAGSKADKSTWTPTIEGDTWVANGLDLTETVQDIVGAQIVAGTGVTVAYNDSTGALTITASGGAGATDPEIVRDTIGTALAGAGLITVTVNDGSDTITISTTATANATDAQLRDRASHTGTQLAATVSDLTETVQDIVGAQLVAGPNATVTYDDGTGAVTIDASLSAIQDANARAGVVYLNDFAGANADAKFAAARTYAMAQTPRPWIEFPPGTTTLNGSYDMWTGMRLRGPGGSAAIGEEVSGGGAIAKIRATGGSGTSSLFKTSATINYVTVRNLTFHADADVQIFHSTGNIYAALFDNLNFYGAVAAFGNATTKCLLTYFHFTGFWTVNAMTGGAFHIGGSDGTLWVAGNANINGASGTAGDGTYQVWLDGLSKSTVGGAYVTCNNGWRGLKVSGASMGVRILGGEYEGMLHANPCAGNVIRVEGGQVFISGAYVGHAMTAPLGTEHGVIEVAGNANTRVAINGVIYRRNTGTPEVAETVPLVYVSGGKADVRQAMADGDNSTWVGLPRVQAAGTGVVTTDAWATVL